VITDETALAASPMMECGCTTGVIAFDGCAMNSAAAAVTASALSLVNFAISNSLHVPAAHLA
jgi:hypothetical protein